MRKKIEFDYEFENLGKKKVIVFEVSPETLISEFNQKMNSNSGLNEYLELLKHCINLTVDEFKQLYPSEKLFIYEKFKEVNADFFLLLPKLKHVIDEIGITKFLSETIQKSGIVEPLKEVMAGILGKSFNDQFAGLLKQGIQMPGSMDGVSSGPV